MAIEWTLYSLLHFTIAVYIARLAYLHDLLISKTSLSKGTEPAEKSNLRFSIQCLVRYPMNHKNKPLKASYLELHKLGSHYQIFDCVALFDLISATRRVGLYFFMRRKAIWVWQ